MAPNIQVVLDCSDPDQLAHFWAEALGYVLQPPPDGFVSWDAFLEDVGVPQESRNDASAIVDPESAGPRFYFQRVPEKKHGKNRVHLDLTVTSRQTPKEERRREIEEEVTRLVRIGASELYRMDREDEYHVTMSDPEGNEFCLQ